MELGIAKKPVDKLKCNSKKNSIISKESKKEMKNRLDKLKTNKK